MSTQTQPAPVLAWHRQADHEANDCARAVVGLVEDHTGKELSLEDCMKITKCVRMAIETCARSDSHYAPLFTARVVVPKLEREIATLKTQHATTVRLLGEAEPYVSRSVIGLANAIRTHLAALQQEGGRQMSANTTTDATATPRTDEAEFFMSTSDKQSPDEGCMMVEAYFARTLERELTAAKAEIARLSNLGWFGKYHKAEADNAQLRAQLRERTQWQCACGGTDCAGQAENERLRADVERQTRETTKWAQSLLARTEAAEVRAARWKEQAEFSETQRTKLDGENDQLRARVADLESQLAASATKAAAEYGEQLKPLFAKVRELEQENTRLTELLRNRLVEVQEQQQGGITT